MMTRFEHRICTWVGIAFTSLAPVAEAVNTITMNTPAHGSSFAAGGNIGVTGTVSYNWLVDSYPYNVFITMSHSTTGTIWFQGNAETFSAAYGSGRFSQNILAPMVSVDTSFLVGSQSRDYYGTPLATALATITVLKAPF